MNVNDIPEFGSAGDPTEFRFSYVNYRGVGGTRRVRASGLFFADGVLKLQAHPLPNGPRRSFVVSSISPTDSPSTEGVFSFSYEGQEFDVQDVSGLRFGSTEWHPREQLLYAAIDLDKGEFREFAVCDMSRAPDAESVEAAS